MNTGEALGYHRADTEVQRYQGCVFTGRSLTIVSSADEVKKKELLYVSTCKSSFWYKENHVMVVWLGRGLPMSRNVIPTEMSKANGVESISKSSK